MGLLSFYNDPEQMGLLGTAAGLLSAGGPSRLPVSFGAALGQGLQQGAQTAQALQSRNLGMALTGEQLKQLQFANRINAAKAAFFAGDGESQPQDAQAAPTGSQAASGGTSTVISNPGANYAVGAPVSGPQAPQNQAPSQPVQPQGGGFPTVPGLSPQMSKAAAFGWLSPSYVSAVASANAPKATRYGVFAPDPGNPGFYRPVGGALPQGSLPYQFDKKGNVNVSPYPGQVETTAQLAGAQAGAKEAAQFPYRMSTSASGAEVPNFTLFGPSVFGSNGEITTPSRIQPQALSPQTPASGKFQGIPKLVVPQGIGQGTYEKTILAKAGESAAELQQKYGSAAEAANQRMAFNNQALSLIDKADTGPKAALIGDVKNWLVSRFGIPESDFANGPSATIALQKDLVNAATQKAKAQFGSRITQNEVQLMLTRASPGVDMTKAAMRYLIQSDNAQLSYQIKQANDLGEYLSQGGDPFRFEGWYARTFPMSKAVEDVHMPTDKNAASHVVRTGTYNGKKVLQRADGTLEYAQ